jgi:integrase
MHNQVLQFINSFAVDEIARFFKACPPRLKPLYALMLVTGARLAELVPSQASRHVALLKSEVDLEAKTVCIRCAKNRLGTEPKTRVLPLPDELIEPLRKQMESVEGDHVFKRTANMRRDFEIILKEAGIAKTDPLGRKVTAHSFRHTYATSMAQAIGNNPFVLKEIMGHRQLSTTDRYCHITAPQVVLPVPIDFGSECERGVGQGCRPDEKDELDWT